MFPADTCCQFRIGATVHDANNIFIAVTSFKIQAVRITLVLIHFVVKMLTGFVIIFARWEEISTSTVCHNIVAEYNPVRHGFSLKSAAKLLLCAGFCKYFKVAKKDYCNILAISLASDLDKPFISIRRPPLLSTIISAKKILDSTRTLEMLALGMIVD